MSHDSDCIQGYEHLIKKEYKIGKKMDQDDHSKYYYYFTIQIQ